MASLMDACNVIGSSRLLMQWRNDGEAMKIWKQNICTLMDLERGVFFSLHVKLSMEYRMAAAFPPQLPHR